MTLACEYCAGSGDGFGAGHPPTAQCGFCCGSGDQKCDLCPDNAVGFNEDGDALCEDCMIEWQCRAFAR